MKQFRQRLADALASGRSVVVQRLVAADLDTPVSAYLKLRPLGGCMLLESVEGGERWGRYSIIAVGHRREIQVLRGGEVQLDGQPVPAPDGPFAALRELTSQTDLMTLEEQKLPRFLGGWVGYLGFGAVHWVEPSVPDEKPEDTPFPDAIFREIDTVVLFDNVRHAMSLLAVVHPDPEQTPDALLDKAEERIRQMQDGLSGAVAEGEITPESDAANEFEPAQSADSFRQAVARLREAILAGDAIQIVLSQRFFADYTGDSFMVYRALRQINPSPYLFYMEFTEGCLIGSSPEVLVRKQGNTATLRPIAGTRKRGATPEEDAALADELLADPKEIAEHVMLVDLGRNDLGRVSSPGSVHVNQQMVIERYSHVMHIVSNIESTLPPEEDAWSLLQATFPAGTVSGAPKVKAMQLIEEVEPQRRGPYAGAVGYIDYRGDMDTGIIIRTIYAWEQTLMLQAGAGIVADSQPESEYQETLNKAGALFAAVRLARNGLAVEP